MFGSDLVPLQLTFNEPLHYWTDYETGKAPLPNFRSPLADIKFIWEPARLAGRSSWDAPIICLRMKNMPGPFGNILSNLLWEIPLPRPHWMNGQEVAIRLMALVWCAHVFYKTGK